MLNSSELVRPFQVVNSHWDTIGENSEKKIHRTTPLNSEEPTSQNSIAALALVTYQAGETVIADGSRTARVLILKKGAVAIIKENTEIAKVTEPGAVFGEFSVLLDQPNALFSAPLGGVTGPARCGVVSWHHAPPPPPGTTKVELLQDSITPSLYSI